MKSENCISPKSRRRYTEAFKIAAVRLGLDTTGPVSQMAQYLGIAAHLALPWRAEQQSAQNQFHSRRSIHAEYDEPAPLK
jgi:transposase-like protein